MHMCVDERQTLSYLTISKWQEPIIFSSDSITNKVREYGHQKLKTVQNSKEKTTVQIKKKKIVHNYFTIPFLFYSSGWEKDPMGGGL